MHSREGQPLPFKDIINPTAKDRNQNQNIIYSRNINKSAQLKLFSYNRLRSNSLNATFSENIGITRTNVQAQSQSGNNITHPDIKKDGESSSKEKESSESIKIKQIKIQDYWLRSLLSTSDLRCSAIANKNQ